MKAHKPAMFHLSLLFACIAFSFIESRAANPLVTLFVDATDAPRKILHARESIPAQPGALTLMYAKWIPGEHGPTGPVTDLVGLKIMTNGKPIMWRRDLEDMYAIHLTVPSGSDRVDLTFDFILPPDAEGFSSGASSSARLVVLSWNQIILFPSDPVPDSIQVAASLRLPDGWKYGTALQTDHEAGGEIQFASTSLTMLVDSPVLAGAHFRRVDITAKSGVPHFIDIASDDEAALEMRPALVDVYKKLVVEANELFGAHHYNQYDFLYTLSDQVAHFGLEHHQSSDDRVAERTLIDDDLRKSSASLLAHEFVHSWNGKHRRPQGLATGDFSTPMKDDLLWVYEGLTQYLGKLLAARSGLRTPEEYREDLALLAADLDNRPGREWRPLQDTNDEAQLLYNARDDWDALRRGTDFYDEGDLIWLEADVTIRQLTKGKKSLNDFCHRFHGGQNSGPWMKPYTFDDVVAALNDVASFAWRTFLTNKLQSLDAHAPLGGIEKSGWKLVYRDTPNSLQKAGESAHKTVDLRYSFGFSLKEDGTIRDLIPGSPAAVAGLAPGMKLVAVNGRKYSKEILRSALKAGTSSKSPLDLLASNGEFYKTYQIDYHGGERYPYLERDASVPDLLSTIIKPIAGK